MFRRFSLFFILGIASPVLAAKPGPAPQPAPAPVAAPTPVPDVEENSGNYSTRRGFMLDFGFGPAMEALEFKDVSFGFNFRIGGGFDEHNILFYQGGGAVVLGSSVESLLSYDATPVVSFHELGYKFVFLEGSSPFITAGVGFSLYYLVDGDGYTANNDMHLGFAVGVGGGYEVRLGHKFFLAPEIQIHYAFADSTSFLPVLFNVQCGWYF